MNIEIENKDFFIRLINQVVYFKPTGYQDEDAVIFFDDTVNHVISEYTHEKLAAISDLRGLILPSPKIALEINKSIKKFSDMIDFRCNAIVIKPRFLEIIKGFVFSFYLRNIHVNSQVFYNIEDAIEWISSQGFDISEIEKVVKDQNKELLSLK